MRAFLVFLLLAACSDRPAAPDATVSLEMHRFRALSRCTDTIRDLVGGGAGVQSFAAGCADIYSEPACRQGLDELAHATNPDAVLPRVAAACGQAYCGKLHDAVCEKSFTTMSRTDLWKSWARLNGLIFAHEMGLAPNDPAARAYAKMFDPVSISVVLPRDGGPASRPTSVTVEVKLADTGVRFAADDLGGELAMVILAVPTAEALAPLAHAIAAKAPGEVVIAADQRVPHGAVVALMEALKTAGIRKLALLVDLESAPAPTPASK